MTPIAEVCVATGAALTGASPPVLSSEVPAGADDTTSADIALAAATRLPASATRPGRAEAKWARTASNEGQTPYDTQHGGSRSSAGTAACAVLAASLRLATAARVGACAAGMSGDAASNTVFVRNLPFNVSDEQVRAARSRRAARG